MTIEGASLYQEKPPPPRPPRAAEECTVHKSLCVRQASEHLACFLGSFTVQHRRSSHTKCFESRLAKGNSRTDSSTYSVYER